MASNEGFLLLSAIGDNDTIGVVVDVLGVVIVILVVVIEGVLIVGIIDVVIIFGIVAGGLTPSLNWFPVAKSPVTKTNNSCPAIQLWLVVTSWLLDPTYGNSSSPEVLFGREYPRPMGILGRAPFC